MIAPCSSGFIREPKQRERERIELKQMTSFLLLHFSKLYIESKMCRDKLKK